MDKCESSRQGPQAGPSASTGPCSATTFSQAAAEAMLSKYIQAAAEAGIVSHLQVKLLKELANDWCSGPAFEDAAAPAPTLPPRHALLASAKESSQSPSTSLPEAPQLHIKPLNLSAGLVHGPKASCQPDAGRISSVLAATSAALGAAMPDSDAAAEGLSSHHAATLMALTAGSSCRAGGFDPAAAAAAASLMQSQPLGQPVASCAPLGPQQQQQQLSEAGPAATSLELLQALCYAADASTAPVPASTAAVAQAAPAAGAGKSSSSRKQRFTREQHAAILESVERNYAQYPSRYTELVIKEMQARFPGIELNNACVRKIKFRANEANKLQQPQQLPQQQQQQQAQLDPANQQEQQAAADAAHGLVGLASAFAAAVAAVSGTDTAACSSPGSAAAAAAAMQSMTVPSTAGLGAGVKLDAAAEAVQEPQVSEGKQAATSPQPAAATGEGVAVIAAAQHRVQSPQHSGSPETVPIGTEQVAAVLLKPQLPQQGQQGSRVQTPSSNAHVAAAVGDRPALALKLPPAAVTATGEDGIDSATAAAAEAMHLLAGISSSVAAQQGGPSADVSYVAAEVGAPPAAEAVDQSGNAGGATPAAAAADFETADAAGLAAGAVLSAKRKRDSAAGGVECDAATIVAPRSCPLSAQVMDALPNGTQLASNGLTASSQAAFMPAAGAAAAAFDQHQQPHVQMPWGGPYGSQVSLLDMHLQQQQALQAQLGAGSSYVGLQQLLPMTTPAGAAAAAGGVGSGQQPAAKRQRLSGVQMAELIASVKHHVQVNPERYTHCVIRDMKEKYPDLELNMGQIRKIKFRTLGNANSTKQAGKNAAETSGTTASASAGYGSTDGACAAAAVGAPAAGAAAAGQE